MRCLSLGVILLVGCAGPSPDVTADLRAQPEVYVPRYTFVPAPSTQPTTGPTGSDRTVLVLPYDAGLPRTYEPGASDYSFDHRYDWQPYELSFWDQFPYFGTTYYFDNPRYRLLYPYRTWRYPFYEHRFYRPAPTYIDRYRFRRDYGFPDHTRDHWRYSRPDRFDRYNRVDRLDRGQPDRGERYRGVRDLSDQQRFRRGETSTGAERPQRRTIRRGD